MANKSIRYGVNLRKRERTIIAQKNTKYKCDLCGKNSVRRVSTGIWHCKYCNATFAGGAYSLKTSAGESVARILGGRA
ncbi:MAG: 50S ribosomal protein L37ae [Candidatus Marsarchaeota archaeon]|nr:50S ribosomal protein L37ae [Candidatus Marsarchaeota archaeon]